MDRWAQVALVAAGSVNFLLLAYLVWNVRNSNKKEAKKLEQQLTEIKQSVSSLVNDQLRYLRTDQSDIQLYTST